MANLNMDGDGRLAPCETSNVGARQPETLPQQVARVLATRMSDIGMTQAELARRANVRQSTLSNMLTARGRNEPRISLLLPVARELGMTLDQVLGIAPPPPPLLRRRHQQIVNAYTNDATVRAALDRMVPPED